jgi:tripartite-type tricarboxylate transporter receptor subunit TctC
MLSMVQPFGIALLGAQETSFQGQTLRIVVGFTSGGGFDTYSRAIARHLGKHIPGHPNIIVENMPGAGSLIAANYTFNQAKPDGLTMGNFIGGLVMGQILGNAAAKFAAQKFEWIGAPGRADEVCALTKASGVTSVDRWMASKAPVKLGSTGAGSDTYDVPRVLQAALGLPIQIVVGYKGTAEVRLAAEGGEVAGICTDWNSIRSTWRNLLDAGDMSVVLQATPKAHLDLPAAPTAISLGKNEESRWLIQSGIHDQSALLRPYALPPGTPKERVKTLRKALQDTMRDPEFMSEAKKSNLAIDPVSGEELDKIIAGLIKMEASQRGKLKEILLPVK